MDDFMDNLSNDPFFQKFFFGGEGDPSGQKQFQQDQQKYEKDW